MESCDAALRLAVERDEALHLGRLLDVVLNAVERLRAVEAVAVDEAMGLLERLNRLAREAAARHRIRQCTRLASRSQEDPRCLLCRNSLRNCIDSPRPLRMKHTEHANEQISQTS